MIPDNLVVSFNTKEQAELIQIIAYKYGYNWFTTIGHDFFKNCLVYIPEETGLCFNPNSQLSYAPLNFYQKKLQIYTIISFEDFFKQY